MLHNHLSTLSIHGEKSVRLFVGLACLFLINTTPLKSQSLEQVSTNFIKGFLQKDTHYILPLIEEGISFVDFDKTKTPIIIHNVLHQLPEIRSIELLDKDQSKFVVEFIYEKYPSYKSNVYLNEKGLINRIELIDDLITQEKEQQDLVGSIKSPSPPSLGDAFRSETITFPSKDGIQITADWYNVDEKSPTIILCHQAGYNRKEYQDIAPRLCDLGFNCLAIDQRSGGKLIGLDNQTMKAAVDAKRSIEMIDASIDISSALDYTKSTSSSKIILWGSSYSASLALMLAEEDESLEAVIGFSPGNYFNDSIPKIESVLKNIEIPFLLLFSNREKDSINKRLKAESFKGNQSIFTPTAKGFHGSKALWKVQEVREEYWNAVESFLASLKL